MNPAAKRKPKRFVVCSTPPSAEQVAHAAALEVEGYEVELLPEQHLDRATEFTLAMQERMDEARARLRTSGRVRTRPTSITEP